MSISDILILTGCRFCKVMDGASFKSKTEKKIMRIWLEHDPVALALLVFGLATVELLAFII